MEWSGKQLKLLETALLRAFPNVSDLQRMVRFNLNEKLAEITGGDTLTDMVFFLLQWAESRGKLDDLLQAARAANPDNPDLVDVEVLISSGADRSGDSPSALTWTALQKQGAQQNSRFLDELEGTATRHEAFIPAVYTRRTSAEATLAAFLTSTDTALILTGDSGVGKTNLLCRWARDLTAGGHTVFFYDCGGSFSIEIEREMAQDLGLDNALHVSPLLKHISAIAPTGKQLVLLFDAVDQFQDDQSGGPAELLKNIDALVGRLPVGAVRVVASCTTAAWQQFNRIGATNLTWRRYYPSSADQPVLRLEPFSHAELETAYTAYQQFFQLQTSWQQLSVTLHDSLTLPLLLRLLAETYEGRAALPGEGGLALTIYKRYYEDRTKRPKNQLFAAALVAAMRQQRRSALDVTDLSTDPRLGPAVLDDSDTSAYHELLENGVLSEMHGDLLTGDLVRFTYTDVGAYVLALSLARNADVTATVTTLLGEAQTFPLAWDAARILLLLRKDMTSFATLAASADIEQRELAVESLVEWYANDTEAALPAIKTLLALDSEEARRTALKAAYTIGAGARDLFLWAAREGSPTLREATSSTLYLLWHNDPTFVADLLRNMTAQIGFLDLLQPKTEGLVEFIIQLSVVILINHIDQPAVIQQISDLYYDLATARLHLDNPVVEAATTVFSQALSGAVIAPLLKAILLEELQTTENLFQLTPAQRAPLKTVVVPLVDPAVDLSAALPQLVPLFESDILFFNAVAAQLIPIHAYRQFAALAEPLAALYDQLGVKGRFWLLYSFTLLLADTPAEWIPLLETFTHRLLTEHPEVFYDDSFGLLTTFDVLLLPLGLAYGKRDQGMPYFEALIRRNLAREDSSYALGRALAGLRAVGFYYPDAVFQTLRAAISDFQAPVLRAALLPLLAAMRTLHFDDVDTFMRQVGLDEPYARQVAARADVSLLRRYILWIGAYNEVVYRCINYPTLRQRLSVELLAQLARHPE